MLKKIFKWGGALIAALGLVAAGILLKAHNHYAGIQEKIHEDPPLALQIEAKEDWHLEGERIARMKGCFDCHGKDLGGVTFINDSAIGVFSGSNLTKGQGGVGKTYSDADWVRAIRYGRGPQKKYLQFMPSQEYAFLTDEDLGKLIAYLKSVPAVDRETTPIQAGPMAKMLYMTGKMPLLFSGEHVDLTHKAPAQLAPNESPEYGKYLAASCVGCHHPNYGGGPIPGVPPSWPPSANLTANGNLARWSFDDFQKTAQTGITPEGKQLNPQFMPWPAMAAMKETELKALYNFLKSLPPN